jgi:hypothetical protein
MQSTHLTADFFHCAAADILAGWGLTVDPNNFNIFKATVPCPPNTCGELQLQPAAGQADVH